MTDKREQLIEEAAKAIQKRATWASLHWPNLDALAHDDVARALAEAALAVFEQEHTPTEHPAHSGHEYGGGYARAAALAAGDPDWMNATGGTPTDDDEREALAEIIDQTPATPEKGQKAAEFWADVVDAILAAGFRRTVQGEPSDEQVEAVAEAMREQGPANTPIWYDWVWERFARAALRAAATQEGETR